MRTIKYLFVFVLIFLFGCANSSNTPEETKNYLEELKSTYECFVSDEIDLKLSVDGVTYETSSKEVKIDGTKISALETGEATIIAKYRDFKKEIKVIIKGKAKFDINKTDYKVGLGEEFTIIVEKENIDELNVKYDNEAFVKTGDKYKAIKVGKYEIEYSYNKLKVICTVEVTDDSKFECPDSIEIFVTEEIELNINIIKGNQKDLVIKPNSDNFEVNGLKIKGVKEGLGSIEISLNSFKKIVEINVIELSINIISSNLEVDYLETAEFKYTYPAFLDDEVEITFSDNTIIKIENGIVYPLKVGKVRVKVAMKENSNIYKSTIVTVKADPIKIISLLKRDTVLMKKEVTTYGNTTRTQSVMGSVFKIYFGNLNLTVDYVPLSSDKYVGMTATPELLKSLDEKGLIRTGIKLEEIKYITYHDTGNNTQGADAKNNINYMKGDYNKSQRARSWHYTVDDKGVWQTIPDDEVSWQGDTYGAYATSIGIETCVNYGINLDIVWHRMGKLCAGLLYSYNLDMSAVKQHYDWNQKNCPQTLRRNNLYGYAKEMIEAELFLNKTISGYKLTFKSLSPEYLDDTGQIIKAPTVPIEVSYEINITNKQGYNETVVFTSTVNPLS